MLRSGKPSVNTNYFPKDMLFLFSIYHCMYASVMVGGGDGGGLTGVAQRDMFFPLESIDLGFKSHFRD